jgi:ATP-dependent Zn protease
MECNDAEKIIVAYHEAGHAIVSYLFDRIVSDVGLVYSSEIKNYFLGGCCHVIGFPSKIKDQKEFIRQRCLIALSGTITEELWAHKYNGKEQINKLCEKIKNSNIKDHDMNIAGECFDEISDAEKVKIIKEFTKEAYNLIESSWETIEVLARYILKYKKINHVEIFNIIHYLNKGIDPNIYFNSFFKKITLFFRQPFYEGVSRHVYGFKLMWLFIKIACSDAKIECLEKLQKFLYY